MPCEHGKPCRCGKAMDTPGHGACPRMGCGGGAARWVGVSLNCHAWACITLLDLPAVPSSGQQMHCTVSHHSGLCHPVWSNIVVAAQQFSVASWFLSMLYHNGMFTQQLHAA